MGFGGGQHRLLLLVKLYISIHPNEEGSINRSMVRRLYATVRVICKTCYVVVRDEQDAVSPGGDALLGARVVHVRVQVELVCWLEMQWCLSKLLERQSGLHTCPRNRTERNGWLDKLVREFTLTVCIDLKLTLIGHSIA